MEECKMSPKLREKVKKFFAPFQNQYDVISATLVRATESYPIARHRKPPSADPGRTEARYLRSSGCAPAHIFSSPDPGYCTGHC